MANSNLPVVGISIGDINGIGIEVIIKSFLDGKLLNQCTPIIFGSTEAIDFYRKLLKIDALSFISIKNIDQAKPSSINILECLPSDLKFDIGKSTREAGNYALKSFETAIECLKQNNIDTLITAPLNKESVNLSIGFSGHTEHLQRRVGATENLMFLVNDSLRVGLVTNHVSVNQVTKKITIDKICQKLRLMQQSLKADFGISNSKIAVLGLNPHAGDNGLIGEEEKVIIQPAIRLANDEGISAHGPFPADGFWGNKTYKNYDGILAMYHDQGLIPFKLLSFGNGVNFTAGLPVIRTSPDHGTAYDIAGKGIASEKSFKKAIALALEILDRRSNVILKNTLSSVMLSLIFL